MKKAQGLPLNTIVIAAIVLVVLLIVIGIIYHTSGRVIPFLWKQTECDGRGGACTADKDCTDSKIYGLGCGKGASKDKPVCCIKEQT